MICKPVTKNSHNLFPSSRKKHLITIAFVGLEDNSKGGASQYVVQSVTTSVKKHQNYTTCIIDNFTLGKWKLQFTEAIAHPLRILYQILERE